MENWNGLIDARWISRIDDTLFLTRCRAGEVTREELHSFVRQQYHYSRHFTRYLCALLSNIPDEGDRHELAHNLWEEMGFGPAGPGASGFGNVPHAQIYREMMARMGVVAADEVPSCETEDLIDTMLGNCRNPDPLVGLGALCLGAEAIVPHVYSQVVAGFVQAGEAEENLEFFRIHIEEDDKHAETMRRIIEKALAKNPATREKLRQSAGETLEARARFFESIGKKETSHVPVQLERLRSHAALA